ncbi:hypothetical protein EG832_00850 [bacterium]|nr:hypothetical protein [bacterium]
MSSKVYPSLEDFTITKSGILHKLMVKLKLGGTSKKEIGARILFIIAITWLPLLVLAALQGLVINDNIDIPFWKDFACHARFLIVIPILIFAEISVDFHLRELTAQFFKSGILDESDYSAFEAIRKKVERLANTYWSDIIILLFIVINLVLRLNKLESDMVSFWFFLPGKAVATLSWSGYWFALVSMPVMQFIMFRWMWRWIIWIIYFSKLSKLPLKLKSAHPDLAGGIGFLGFPPGPFTQVLFALAILFATTIAENIFFLRGTLPTFYPVMVGFAVISVLVNLAPLLVFTKPLQMQRRKGVFDYTTLIHEHHMQFDAKWFKNPHEEELTGMPDASSMADLNSSFDIVRRMRLFPFDIKIMMSSILFAIVPMLPLFAFEYNLVELLGKILKMLA